MNGRYISSVGPPEFMRARKAAMDEITSQRNRLQQEKKAFKKDIKTINKNRNTFAIYKEQWKRTKKLAKDLSSIIDTASNVHTIHAALNELSSAIATGPPLSLDELQDISSKGVPLHVSPTDKENTLIKREKQLAVELVRQRVVQTTVDNAACAQLFADFFEQRGAGRVFEDAVRPWVSRAIHCPLGPPLANKLCSRCTCCSFQSKELTSRCTDCQAFVCGGCKCDMFHLCPNAPFTPEFLNVEIAALRAKIEFLPSRMHAGPKPEKYEQKLAVVLHCQEFLRVNGPEYATQTPVVAVTPADPPISKKTHRPVCFDDSDDEMDGDSDDDLDEMDGDFECTDDDSDDDDSDDDDSDDDDSDDDDSDDFAVKRKSPKINISTWSRDDDDVI